MNIVQKMSGRSLLKGSPLRLLIVLVLACSTSSTAFSPTVRFTPLHVSTAASTQSVRFTCSTASIRLHESINTNREDSTAEEESKQLRISFVTGNEMKRSEVETILNEHGATRGPTPDTSLVDLRLLNVDLPEIQEINTEAIAKNKAIQAAQLANGPCVVEDTSLKFNALGGMPGPFIKWFQEKLKSEGLYRILRDYDDKSAEAVCTLAFCPAPHADPVVFTGRTKGTIVAPVEGRGFGWDSIFVPDGEEKPFSCMTTEEKCKMSHRGKAVRQWADWLGANEGALWERQEGKISVGHKGLDFKAMFSEQ